MILDLLLEHFTKIIAIDLPVYLNQLSPTTYHRRRT